MKKILVLSFIFFLLSGLSAYLWPAAWYALAGAEVQQSNLILYVVGAMMLGLSYLCFAGIKYGGIVAVVALRSSAIAFVCDIVALCLALFHNLVAWPNALGFICFDLLCLVMFIKQLRRQ